MALNNWPPMLPCPLMDGYSDGVQPNVIRSDMDVGPQKLRRRSTADTVNISFNLLLKSSDVSVLDAFYRVETKSGTLPFNFVHPRTKQTVECRFLSAPSYGSRSGWYSANISLEVLP